MPKESMELKGNKENLEVKENLEMQDSMEAQVLLALQVHQEVLDKKEEEVY